MRTYGNLVPYTQSGAIVEVEHQDEATVTGRYAAHDALADQRVGLVLSVMGSPACSRTELAAPLGRPVTTISTTTYSVVSHARYSLAIQSIDQSVLQRKPLLIRARAALGSRRFNRLA